MAFGGQARPGADGLLAPEKCTRCWWSAIPWLSRACKAADDTLSRTVCRGLARRIRKSLRLVRSVWEPWVRAPEETTVFEAKTKVDQVLHFFENEFERYEGYAPDAAALERQRIEYYNYVDAIEFQSEQMAYLVDELLQLRERIRMRSRSKEFRALELTAMKEAAIRIAHIKLDIGERRSKRGAKEKARQVLLGTLSPLISEIKMQRMQDEAASAAIPEQPAGVTEPAHATSSCGSQVWGGATEARTKTVSRRNRNYKLYSDSELAAILRDDS